ncbi:MAG: hypothetical protein ACREJD_02900 [Phycisphaerales bacterium]
MTSDQADILWVRWFNLQAEFVQLWEGVIEHDDPEWRCDIIRTEQNRLRTQMGERAFRSRVYDIWGSAGP